MTLLVLLIPASAFAAVNGAQVEAINAYDTDLTQASVRYTNNGNQADYDYPIFSTAGVTTPEAYESRLIAATIANAATHGYTLTQNQIIWPYYDTARVNSLIAAATSTLAAVEPVVTAPSLSVQTSTGAVGTQVSTTTNSYVMIAGQVSTTASIAGNASGDMIVEVAPTNSATSSDWVEWGRIGNSQTLSLAITLQSVQVVKGQVMAFVPKGWYVKVRSSGSGTVSYTLNTVKAITQ